MEGSEESTNQDDNCWEDESNDTVPPDPYILRQHKVHMQELVKPHSHICKEICRRSCGCLPRLCRILWGRSTWGLQGAEQAASRAAEAGGLLSASAATSCCTKITKNMEFLPVCKWPLHSKKPVDTDA